MNFYNNSAKNNATTHGLSRTPIYKIWKRMLYKVEQTNTEIDPEWLYLQSFMDDMDKPVLEAKRLVMTRIDPNGPYKKSNCAFKIG
jgi:hypothetical protein